MYIRTWDEVPVGAVVIEDTYNEVYEVFLKSDDKWLRQIRWQYGNEPVPHFERPCDFNPSSPYDQPWIRLE